MRRDAHLTKVGDAVCAGVSLVCTKSEIMGLTLVKTGLGIGHRCMRRVRSLMPAKFGFGISVAAGLGLFSHLYKDGRPVRIFVSAVQAPLIRDISAT